MSTNLNLKKNSISLEKGSKINLSKEVEGLSNVILGLGWDIARPKRGLFGFGSASTPNIDCDASAFMLGSNGKLLNSRSVVYFGNLKSDCKSVIHTGDNLTGDGDGDDEQLIVDLNKVPSNVEEILFVVNIFSAKSKGQHFGMIENAFIRIVDNKTNEELAKFNLTENYSGKTAMIFGSLKRTNGQWEFNAIGEGTTDGSVSELARRYK